MGTNWCILSTLILHITNKREIKNQPDGLQSLKKDYFKFIFVEVCIFDFERVRERVEI